ncbi:receptor protein kinase-like protein [Tribonema minus]|uniref:Receptor protein kinase-like protein n=1 Tax=Tribonema minus TaxID=303371 RepID=A0A836CCE9_9STRA|nr:receptor protein kinase-like protein [Tribonema minus]
MSGIDIWEAASEGDLDAVQEYLAANGNPNARDSTYHAPLHHAARGGHRDVVDALLGRGAGVSIQTQSGETPLHCACAAGHTRCALALLAAGADPSHRDFRGRTAADELATRREGGGGGDEDASHLQWLLTEASRDAIKLSAKRALRHSDALAPPLPPPDAAAGDDYRGADEAAALNAAAAADAPPTAAAAHTEVLRLLKETTALEARAAAAEARAAQSEGSLAAAVAELAAARERVSALGDALRQRDAQVSALSRRLAAAEEALRSAGAQGSAAAALEPRVYSAADLSTACEGFAVTRLVGRGSSGAVYRGTLQGNEVAVLMMCRHESLLPLLGLCLEEPLSLVYPYMANGSLDVHLHGAARRGALTWRVRVSAALAVASALHYLHTPWGSKPAICHRDVKPANVLLDESMAVRLGDAGIASIMDQSRGVNGTAATQLQGTLNYLDPAYLRTGALTEKSDIYSLGVVIVELLMGSVCTPGMVNRVRGSLLGSASTLADGSVEWPEGAVDKLGQQAHSCCHEDPAKRPELPSVITALEELVGGAPTGSEDAAQPRECKICLSARPNTRFRPCLHSVACEQDASLLLERRGRCPLCRELILDIEIGEFSQTFVVA